MSLKRFRSKVQGINGRAYEMIDASRPSERGKLRVYICQLKWETGVMVCIYNICFSKVISQVHVYHVCQIKFLNDAIIPTTFNAQTLQRK